MMSLITGSGADHQLHYLNGPEEVCKARLRARNQAGTHQFSVTDEQFELISRHFVAPEPEEGFHVIRHD